MIRMFFSSYLLLIACLLSYGYLGETLLRITVKDWIDQDMRDNFVGVFYLIDELQKRTDPQTLKSLLQGWPKESNVPLTTLPLNHESLSEEQRSLLVEGQIVVEDAENHVVSYRLEKTSQIVRVGPIGTHHSLNTVVEIFNQTILLVLALPVIFWIVRMQRRFKLLDHAAQVLGEGDFSFRVSEAAKDRVGNLNHTFNTMASKIQHLVEGHKSLTNAVAHELRTPVARLRFQLDMLNQETDPQEQQEYLYGMSDDLNELGELVEEILVYARFERESLLLQLKPNSLHHSLLTVIEQRDFDGGFDHGSVQLNYNINWFEKGKEPLLPFEPRHLERAIGNLVSNGQKYAKSWVGISVDLEEDRCTIVVADDGPGIDPADQEKVWQPFARLDNSRTRSTGGYGLGLAIVKQIAQRHGGEVSIGRSQHGGAAVRFSWPTSNSKQ